MPEENDNLTPTYSLAEAVRIANVGRTTLWRAMSQGRGPRVTQVGARERVTQPDLDAWIAAGAQWSVRDLSPADYEAEKAAILQDASAAELQFLENASSQLNRR